MQRAHENHEGREQEAGADLQDLDFKFERPSEIVALDGSRESGIIDPSAYYPPTVVERRNGVERAYDIYSRLLEDRNIFLRTGINDDVAASVIAQLLFLEKENSSADINLYIMSPGGSVTAGLAIKDVMDFVKADVATYCVGQAASMGAVLLAAGAPGKRFALPNARIMIHQPHIQGVGGQATELEIMTNEINRLKLTLNEILAERSGKTVKEVEQATDRDNFMSAEQAKNFGIIDEIIDNKQLP